MQQRGVDLYERMRTGPLNRVVGLLHAVLVEQIAWADDELRKTVLDLLEWPATTDTHDLAESTKMAAATLAALGQDASMLGNR